MHTLFGKRILITGASQGLGRQMAIGFAKSQAKSLVLVARRKDLLDDLATTIRQLTKDTEVLTIAADLNNDADIERLVATTLAKLDGQLDVLVNNASVLGPTPMPYLLDYPIEDFETVLKVNLVAPFQLIKKFLPALVASQGSIINITSDAGVNGYPGWGAYGISKFGLEGLSQTWAQELAESGVRLNWVDPGNMNTQMHRNAEPDEDPTEWADPKDVAPFFVWLASNQASTIHGQRFCAQDELVQAKSIS